jgi:hypothetical protein
METGAAEQADHGAWNPWIRETTERASRSPAQRKPISMRKRLFLFVLFVFLLLYGAQIISLDLYPLIDLPYHLSAATIYRFHDAPDNAFSQFYSIDMLPNPNISHLLFCGSDLFPSVETANRIFLCLYVVLLPLAVFLLVRKLRGDPWFSLLTFTILYHYSFSWGFVGFTMSVPFVLLAFYVLLQHADRPRVLYRIMLALLLLLLFCMHVLCALLCVVMVLLHCIRLSGTSLRTAGQDALILLPVVVVIALWQSSVAGAGGPSTFDSLWRYYQSEYLPTIYRRAGLFLWDNFALQRGAVGFLVAAFFSVFIVAFPLTSWIRRRGEILARLRRFDLSPVHLLLLAALLAYLFLPRKIPGTAHLYERFSVFVLIALIIHGSRVASLRYRRFTRIAICGVCLLHFGLWSNYYQEFRKDVSSFRSDVLPEAEGNQKLAAWIFDYEFRGRPVYNHFQDYYTVWKQGIAVSRVGDYRYYPIRRRASLDELPAYNEWVGKWGEYDGSYAKMDYILVRGEIPGDMRKYLEGFTQQKARDTWVLYRKAGDL